MTSVCGGGPSGIIPGTQQIQTMLASAIVGSLVSGELSWLAELASGIGYVTFDLLGVCNTDPPGYPTFDLTRVESYLLSPQGAQFLREDVVQALQTLLWYQYCHCLSDPQPVAPTPPGPPDGYQTDNPNVQNPQGGTPCASRTWFSSTPISASGTFSQTPNGNSALTVHPQWARLTHNTGITGATGGYPITFTLQWLSALNGPVIGTQQFVEDQSRPAANPYIDNFLVPTGVVAVNLIGQTTLTTAATLGLNTFMDLFCTPAPTSLDVPCCPPDPILENMLVQVLQLEQLILQQIGGSKAYIRGATHSGLTGTGTINVNGLFGVLVELTSGTPTVPVLPGVPPYQFSVGWISCLTGDGMIDEIRITRQAQVWSSRLAPFATQFGFQLNAGFSANITELLPA